MNYETDYSGTVSNVGSESKGGLFALMLIMVLIHRVTLTLVIIRGMLLVAMVKQLLMQIS